MFKIKAMTIYVVGCIVVGIIAKGRGRSGLGWAFLSFFITPLLAGGLVVLLRAGNGPRNPWN